MFDILKQIADNYESYILSKTTIMKFYRDMEFSEKYEDFKAKIVSNLQFIGSGSCCVVYDGGEYVLKLHTPYGDKIDLHSNPTKEQVLEWKKYPKPCKETNFADPFAAQYMLCFEYVTPAGFAGIQKKADCSLHGRKEAYRLFMQIHPFLCRYNNLSNMGLFEGKPVYVDWD